MLDRIRIQEVEKAIFRMREERPYGGRRIAKNEPFLIVDKAAVSDFNVVKRSIAEVGRSTEATGAIIKGITFNLTNGQVMMDLFNAIFGNISSSQSTTFTVTGDYDMGDSNELVLPTQPDGQVFLYLYTDNGLKKICENQYEFKGNEEQKRTIELKSGIGEYGGYYIEFKNEDYKNKTIKYIYDERVNNVTRSSIGQIGEDIIGTLEMQCIAYDIYKEEQMRILIKFEKVSVSTSLRISFNNSEKATSSIISVHALVPELQNGINKKIMTIELLDYIDDTEEQRLNKELDNILNMPDLPEEPEEPIESA
jgi:hypothetical protein